MNEILERLLDEARGAWRFRWTGLAVAAVAALGGWLTVFSLTDLYEAKASVFVDARTALKPLLQGLTVEQDVGVQLSYVRQSWLSGAELEKVATESGMLDPKNTDPRVRASIIKDLSDKIVLDSHGGYGREADRDSSGTTYTFSYRGPDRKLALRVVDTLVTAFIEETLGGKRSGTEHAQRFIEQQIHSYEQRLREAENRLAEFKKTNLGLMPTEQGGYFTQLQNEIDAEKKIENDLNQAISRRTELARQLRGDAVMSAAGSSNALAAAGGDTLARIKEAQARLDELRLRFTDKHPDVTAARATLAELQARRDAEIESLKRGDLTALASSGIGNNPVYQSIQLALNQADVEIAALRSQLTQHHSKASELRQRLDIAPKVEAQYAQLNRDYDINKAQYTALMANYEKSRLGEQADSAGSVRFEVTQAPTAPYGAVYPDRPTVLSAIFVVSLLLGLAASFGLHLLNPVVTSRRNLMELTSIPILGTVSAAFPLVRHIQTRREALRFGVAASGLLAAYVLAITVNYIGLRFMPEALLSG